MAFSCLRNSLRICWFGAAFVIVIPMTQESFPLKIPLVNFYIAGLTDVGLRRDHNEDHFYLSQLPLESGKPALVDASACRIDPSATGSSALCIVADGMGGASSGEVASEMATSGVACALNGEFESLRSLPEGEAIQRLLDTSVAVNQTLWDASAASLELRGMGTTLTAMLVMGNRAYWLQSGDSRLYRLRNGLLEILTPDQSAVGQLFQQGNITEEQARRHPYKNVIDQCMGGNADDPFEPAAGSFELQVGDAYVLCSDGLMDGLWDGEIQDRLELLGKGKSPVEVVERLVLDAKVASGNDNITAIVGYFAPDPSTASTAAKTVGDWIRERALGQRYFDITPKNTKIH